MEDKLTGKDFLAVIGILTIAGFVYALWSTKEKREHSAKIIATDTLSTDIPMSQSGVYVKSNVLDGYMQVYDASEASTIGVTEMVVKN